MCAGGNLATINKDGGSSIRLKLDKHLGLSFTLSPTTSSSSSSSSSGYLELFFKCETVQYKFTQQKNAASLNVPSNTNLFGATVAGGGASAVSALKAAAAVKAAEPLTHTDLLSRIRDATSGLP